MSSPKIGLWIPFPPLVVGILTHHVVIEMQRGIILSQVGEGRAFQHQILVLVPVVHVLLDGLGTKRFVGHWVVEGLLPDLLLDDKGVHGGLGSGDNGADSPVRRSAPPGHCTFGIGDIIVQGNEQAGASSRRATADHNALRIDVPLRGLGAQELHCP